MELSQEFLPDLVGGGEQEARNRRVNEHVKHAKFKYAFCVQNVLIPPIYILLHNKCYKK
jgi:hypothetical protein